MHVLSQSNKLNQPTNKRINQPIHSINKQTNMCTALDVLIQSNNQSDRQTNESIDQETETNKQWHAGSGVHSIDTSTWVLTLVVHHVSHACSFIVCVDMRSHASSTDSHATGGKAKVHPINASKLCSIQPCHILSHFQQSKHLLI